MLYHLAGPEAEENQPLSPQNLITAQMAARLFIDSELFAGTVRLVKQGVKAQPVVLKNALAVLVNGTYLLTRLPENDTAAAQMRGKAKSLGLKHAAEALQRQLRDPKGSGQFKWKEGQEHLMESLMQDMESHVGEVIKQLLQPGTCTHLQQPQPQQQQQRRHSEAAARAHGGTGEHSHSAQRQASRGLAESSGGKAQPSQADGKRAAPEGGPSSSRAAGGGQEQQRRALLHAKMEPDEHVVPTGPTGPLPAGAATPSGPGPSAPPSHMGATARAGPTVGEKRQRSELKPEPEVVDLTDLTSDDEDGDVGAGRMPGAAATAAAPQAAAACADAAPAAKVARMSSASGSPPSSGPGSPRSARDPRRGLKAAGATTTAARSGAMDAGPINTAVGAPSTSTAGAGPSTQLASGPAAHAATGAAPMDEDADAGDEAVGAEAPGPSTAAAVCMWGGGEGPLVLDGGHVDPEWFAALPAEMQAEVLSAQEQAALLAQFATGSLRGAAAGPGPSSGPSIAAGADGAGPSGAQVVPEQGMQAEGTCMEASPSGPAPAAAPPPAPTPVQPGAQAPTDPQPPLPAPELNNAELAQPVAAAAPTPMQPPTAAPAAPAEAEAAAVPAPASPKADQLVPAIEQMQPEAGQAVAAAAPGPALPPQRDGTPPPEQQAPAGMALEEPAAAVAPTVKVAAAIVGTAAAEPVASGSGASTATAAEGEGPPPTGCGGTAVGAAAQASSTVSPAAASEHLPAEAGPGKAEGCDAQLAELQLPQPMDCGSPPISPPTQKQHTLPASPRSQQKQAATVAVHIAAAAATLIRAHGLEPAGPADDGSDPESSAGTSAAAAAQPSTEQVVVAAAGPSQDAGSPSTAAPADECQVAEPAPQADAGTAAEAALPAAQGTGDAVQAAPSNHGAEQVPEVTGQPGVQQAHIPPPPDGETTGTDQQLLLGSIHAEAGGAAAVPEGTGEVPLVEEISELLKLRAMLQQHHASTAAAAQAAGGGPGSCSKSDMEVDADYGDDLSLSDLIQRIKHLAGSLCTQHTQALDARASKEEAQQRQQEECERQVQALQAENQQLRGERDQSSKELAAAQSQVHSLTTQADEVGATAAQHAACGRSQCGWGSWVVVIVVGCVTLRLLAHPVL